MFEFLELRNFRSHHDKFVKFSPGVNIITGQNGSGKTNLIEALYVLSRGKSFRVKDKYLIEDGQSWIKINTKYNHIERKLKLIQEDDNRINKLFQIDSQEYKRLIDKQKIPVSLFEPGHLQILYGGPESRRILIDSLLEQLDTTYKTTLNGYKRSLLQRNNLLRKKQNIKKDEIFIWDVRLSEFGDKINKKRHDLIKIINSQICVSYQSIASSKDNIELKYITGSNIDYGSWLMRQLESNLHIDKISGFTSVGPHRDDVKFYINNEEVSVTASRGEIRSILLAFKFIEIKLLEQELGVQPIIILDDVFSELDNTRQQHLTEFFTDNQVFITTTHKTPTLKYNNIINL